MGFLARQTETPQDEIAALPIETICERIGAAQHAMAVDIARGVRIRPDKEQGPERAKLARSTSDIDRIAAETLARWTDEERTRR